MQVLILKTNQIQEVKDSYAVNYLIPKGLAVVASDKVIKDLNQKQELRLTQSQEKKTKQQDLVEKLNGKTFIIKAKATSGGNLYASINNNQLKKLLKIKEAIEIENNETIKSLGQYQINIKIGSFKSTVNLKVQALA